MKRSNSFDTPLAGSILKTGFVLGVCSLFGLAWASAAQAAPEVDQHDLIWYVHVDLVNPGAGEDLAYWQGVIDSAMASSNRLLEGRQGPTDEPCCTRLTGSTPLSTFGSPGDGLDVIDSPADQTALSEIGGATGSKAFLVDSTTWCGGSSPGSIGCAVVPGCSANGNDDPDLWMYATVDAFEAGTLASVIAHERGHNACLNHVANKTCELMNATVFTPGLGGCLGVSECTNYRSARTVTSSGVECGCHDDVSGLLADGESCTEVASGICSGGLCGSWLGDAGVMLLSAADPGDFGGPPEDALRISGLSGDWSNLGQISASAQDVRGLAWAHDSQTLYGIVPTVGDDTLITIDPETGAMTGTVGAISNGVREIVSLAYDPGATNSPNDDRLLALDVDGSFGDFLAIDPASVSTPTVLGGIATGPAVNFSGMAYDSLQGKLFLASLFGPSGFFEVDLGACTPFSCPVTGLPWTVRAWENASLGFSKETGKLYLVGNQTYGPSDTTTFFAVIDPVTGISEPAISVDRYSPAGLAALPVPEPGFVTGITASLLALALTARRRRDHFVVDPS